MEAALVYLELELVLTLFGLTHSAWWDRSLKEGIGLLQNSQGRRTVLDSVDSEDSPLGLFKAELTIEELVDLQAKCDVTLDNFC